MKKKNKGRYLKTFKSHAINLVVNDGISVRSAAKQLSMPKSTLAGWVRKSQREKFIEKSVLPKEPPIDSTEIEQLKQELAKVKTERDDLKKKAEIIPYSPEVHLELSREDVVTKQLYTDNTESLLDTARTQWQFGDWESLASLDGNKLQNHPDRAKLALLVATGWQQLNDQKKTHKYIKLARKWGCDKQLIARLLIAGVHNTLGCAAAAGRQENRALNHFRSAVKGVSGDARLACQARSVREITKLGLLQQAATQISQELNGILPQKTAGRQAGLAASGIKVLQTEIELLQHELSLAHQRQQLFPPTSEMLVSERGQNNEEWLKVVRKKSVSQLGQDLWVLEQTNFKREGFFVEFGATNGVLLSNTYLLEKEFGWQGICAEPNPTFFQQLKENRNCKVSNVCIGAKTGERVSFVYAGEYGGMLQHAEDDMHADKRHAYAELPGMTAELLTVSLNDFLVSLEAPRSIDYLSIDTEGSEFDILNSFPFDKWRIRLITVEHNFTPRRTDIRVLLEQHGYRCIEQQWDDWYEKEV